jgi:peptide/nickel transport system permease protein
VIVARFLVRRILQGILVMWLVTVSVFLIFFVGPGPGSVARTLAGKQATPQVVAEVSHRLLLDRPLWVQYGHFLWLLLHGNLGYSFYHGQSVNSVIAAAFPITLSLVIGAAILWVIMGVLSGVLSAVRARSIMDRTFTGLALFFYSMPTFVLGLLFLLVFYYEFTIHGISFFPGSGYTPLTQDPLGWLRGMILPWFTLALVSAATYTRLTRGSMLDVMGEDYIRTARAKGLSERRVIFRHSLRAALTPVVTQYGIDVGVLLGGAVITEVVFGMPGLGFTAVQSIQQQDLPVIIGVVIVASAAVVVANIVVDALYAVLDPRVRLH